MARSRQGMHDITKRHYSIKTAQVTDFLNREFESDFDDIESNEKARRLNIRQLKAFRHSL